jgi:hypothetical protein
MLQLLQKGKQMPRKLSKKQKALASVAKPRNKITGADFKKLNKRKKQK